ncbi:hypothetical protein [Vibrio phage vB_VaS_L1]|nr:hypothetical protein [Vibrio phage vB_VaS_L1]
MSMATKIIKPAVVEKTCDMCGDVKKNFIGSSKFTIGRGFVYSQSDRWEKTISVNVSASIPYSPCEDVCTDCLRESFAQVIRDIEEE